MSNFNYFKLEEIFHIARGKRLVKADQQTGEIAYISSTKFNNGIDNYITPPKNMIIYSNAITISNSGSVGYSFYHEYEFVGSDHVTILLLKDTDMTKEIAMYMIPLLNKLRVNYVFNREMSNARLKKESILLPILENGKIDFTFIKKFISNISKNVIWREEDCKESKELVIKPFSFERFPLTYFFDIRGCKKKITKASLENGEYLYITTSNKNYGFSGFHNEYCEEPGVFSIDSATDGKCFYQTSKFIGSDHVEILEFKTEFKSYNNLYVGLYFQTLLNFYLDKYQFSRKRAQLRIKKEFLYLPILKNGDVDWNFMEKYIKSCKYGDNLQ